MYRVLIEDAGTEGFGVVLDVKVKAVSLLMKSFTVEEGDSVRLVHRGWSSNYESLGVMVMAVQLMKNGLSEGFGPGSQLPDEDVGEEEHVT